MKRQRSFFTKLVIYSSLLTLMLLGGSISRVIAQDPWPAPVQLIPPAQLDQSSTFMATQIKASIISLSGSQLLGNPDFENNNWLPWETFGTPALDNSNPHSGTKSAHLGNINNANDQVIQVITFPADTNAITLNFWYRLDTTEIGANA